MGACRKLVVALAVVVGSAAQMQLASAAEGGGKTNVVFASGFHETFGEEQRGYISTEMRILSEVLSQSYNLMRNASSALAQEMRNANFYFQDGVISMNGEKCPLLPTPRNGKALKRFEEEKRYRGTRYLANEFLPANDADVVVFTHIPEALVKQYREQSRNNIQIWVRAFYKAQGTKSMEQAVLTREMINGFQIEKIKVRLEEAAIGAVRNTLRTAGILQGNSGDEGSAESNGDGTAGGGKKTMF